jgi:3-deoxy-7-phosphoheptulonate synthase
VLVVMKRDATKAEIDGVVARIGELGLTAVPLPGAERTAIGTFGVAAREYEEQLESMPGVQEIVYVSKPFKLASREVRPADTIVSVRGVEIGSGKPLAVIAGPCSVESRDQTLATARAVRDAGATFLRGGAYKPSTSPYQFRGLGEPGLAILEEARAATGLPIVTEVLTPADVALVAR